MSLFKKLFAKNKKEDQVEANQHKSEKILEPALEEAMEKAEDQQEAGEDEAKQYDTISEKLEITEAQVEEAIEERQLTREGSSCEAELIKEEITDEEPVVSPMNTYEMELDGSHPAESADVVEVAEDDKKTEAEAPKKQGFVKRLFIGLSKTRDQILKGVDDVLSNFKHIDDELYDELEEALIMADFGVDTTLHIMDKLKQKVREEKLSDPAALKPALQQIITEFLTDQSYEEILNPNGPTVILVIGVNGVGKTTSIGKMSHLFKSQGKKVLVAAADTFRAAAIEQLNVWTDRAGVEIIKHDEGSDAAAVVFDAISAAKSRRCDVLICDTAGRLQNKTNLMKELEKISRIIVREYPDAKQEILITIDANTGQNALQQVKLFKEVANISGIILTKLDGTAKGGAIVGIYDGLKVPVKYVGVGEKIDDLQAFDAKAFARALFETEA